MPLTLVLPPEAQLIVDKIVERFHPQKIIVFGSYARGTADEESDLDLLVVMETEMRPLYQAAEIAVTLDHHLPVDVLVRRPNQVEKRDDGDIMLNTILDEGVVVHEAQS